MPDLKFDLSQVDLAECNEEHRKDKTGLNDRKRDVGKFVRTLQEGDVDVNKITQYARDHCN